MCSGLLMWLGDCGITMPYLYVYRAFSHFTLVLGVQNTWEMLCCHTECCGETGESCQSQLLTGARWKPSQFLLGSANSGFLALHMSIMAGRALNDLENRFLTKMCLLNSSVVWVPRFISPHYSFPLGDTRDPTILGLQLQDCMNIIHIPNSPSAVTKPESKSFVNMN